MKKFVVLFLLLFLVACDNETHMSSLNSSYYKVDPEIASEVDKNTNREGELEMGSMEIRFFENDRLVKETFSSEEFVPFWIMKERTPVSLELSGVVGMFDASGFQLSLTKTDYKVTYFSGSDFGIYKLQKEDTILIPGINLECKARSLTLEKKFNFKKDEEITGIVEFKTPDYWMVTNGSEKKIRIEAKAYFKTTFNQ